MRIQQSVCVPMIKPANIPLEPFIEKSAGIGYKAIELWFREDNFAEFLGIGHQVSPGSLVHDGPRQPELWCE